MTRPALGVLVSCLLCGVLPLRVLAQPVVPAPAPVAAASAPPLDAAEPTADGLDWVQLTNGEWMQGKLVGLRDGDLEFDSDEFGLHTVEFGDVKRLFIRRKVEVGLESLETLQGPATLNADGTMTVQTPGGPRSIPRAQVLSMVPSGHSELGYWSLDLSLGVSVAKGNSDQGSGSAAAMIEREDGFTHLLMDYLWNFGASQGDRNVNNHRALAKLDLFLSKYFFITPASMTVEYDEFKNINERITPVAGVGVHAINTSRVEWDFMTAAGYQYTRYLSVLAGEPDDAHNAAVSLGTVLDIEATDELDLYFEYTNLLVVTDLGLTTHHAVAEVEVEITDIFDFQLRAILDRIEQPVTAEDGTTPYKNDLQLVAAVGLELN